MPDLRDSFDELRRDLDAAQPPDMLADAFHRTPSMGEPDSPSPWRKLGIITLALVIAVASTFFAISVFDREQSGPAANANVLPYPLAYSGADAPDTDWSHGQLWLMDEAGHRTTLASVPGVQTAVPAWSPDGSQIAFAAELDDLGTQIWVIDADGTNLHEVTRMVPMDGSAINDAPAWSPDGTQIAFNCYDGSGMHGVCVVNADGSGNPRELTDGINVRHDTPPVWLRPTELMFSTSGPPADGTFTLSLDGGEPTRIGAARPQMTLSPDRARIAFLCSTKAGYAICTESTDLTGREQVTSPPTDMAAAITDSDSFPAWLPDGRLSFVRESRAFDGFHLYFVDAHGGEPTELANLGNDVRGFGWGPNEDQIETPNPAPQATDSATPSPATPIEASTTTFDTGLRFLEGAVVADGSVWIAGSDGSSEGGQVVRMDPRTGKVLARIDVPVPGWEFGGAGLTAADGSVWIASGPSGDQSAQGGGWLYRIDPATDTVADAVRIGDQNPADLWVDDAGIWVLSWGDSGSMTVSRLDLNTYAVLGTKSIRTSWSQTVAHAGGNVWVFGSTQGDAPAETLFKLDPQTLSLADQLQPTEGSSFFLVVSGDRLWFFHDGLRALDASAGQPDIGPLNLDFPEGDCCAALTPDGVGGVWVLSASHEHPGVWHVDAAGTIDRVSDATLGASLDGSASAFDADSNSIWVVHYDGSVTRVQI